tara:strand:- start:72 stop:8093 length:8022 start_codon:yes stop_codon:yes gene_type:complete
MGYVPQTAQAAYRGSKHTPGWIDRVFNTTFGVIQQPLWRIWRAAKEKDIDLWSKEGVVDPALLPILGMAFDNSNTVMADELFGDNLGAQIAGSILTDPLSFATGGLTATAKTSRALAKAIQGGAKGKAVKGGKEVDLTNDTTQAFHRAAKYGAGKLDEVADAKVGDKAVLEMQDMTVQQLIDGMQHGAKNTGFIDEASNMLGKSLTNDEILDLQNMAGKLGGLSDDIKAGTVADLLAQQKKREMGLGLPILGDFFGMYVAGPKWLQDHGGWMKWYFTNVGRVYKTPLKLAHHMTDPLTRHVPVLNKTIEKTKQVVEHYSKGWQEGPVPKAVANYLARGAQPLVNAEDGAVMAGTTATKIYDQAYVDTGRGRLSVLRNEVPMDEHVDLLSRQLIAESEVNGISYTQQIARRFGPGYKALFGKTLDNYDNLVDQEAAFKSIMADFLYKKEVGQISSETYSFDVNLGKMLPTSAAYRMGRSHRMFFNKVFKNDLGLNGAEELNRFQRRLEAQHTQQQEAMAHKFYAQVQAVKEETGLSTEAINKLVFAKLSLTSSPDEISSFVSFLDSGSTTLKQWSQELHEFLGGRVSSNLEFLKGVAANEMAGGTSKMLEMLDALSMPSIKISEKVLESASPYDQALLKQLQAGGRIDPTEKLRLVKQYGIEDERVLFTRMHNGELSLDKVSDWVLEPWSKVNGKQSVIFAANEGNVLQMTLGASGDYQGRALATFSKEDLFGKKGTGGIFSDIESRLKRAEDALTSAKKEGDSGPSLFQLEEEVFALRADKEALIKMRSLMTDDYKMANPDLINTGRLRPTYRRVVTALGEYDDGTAITLNDVGKAFGDVGGDVKDLANVVTRLRTRQAFLDQYVTLQGGSLNNVGKGIPEEFIAGFKDDLEALDKLMREALEKPMSVGKNGEFSPEAAKLFNMLEDQRDITRRVALDNDILPAGTTPLGYMKRVTSGNEYDVLTESLNDVIINDDGLKQALTPTLASARQLRSFSVEDLNYIHQQLKLVENHNPQFAPLIERIEDVREQLFKTRDFEKYTTDPVAAIVAHQSQVQKALHDRKWIEFVAENGSEYGITQGRIIDIIVDEGGEIVTPIVSGSRPVIQRAGEVPAKDMVTAAASAGEALAGVRATNAGKTDFNLLVPESYWVRDGKNIARGADHARKTLNSMYDNGVLNESGVLMIREAFRMNPRLFRGVDIETAATQTGAMIDAMQRKGTKKLIKGLQNQHASNFMGTLAVGAMKGMREADELGAAQVTLLRELGEDGFVQWATKNFNIDESMAREAMTSSDSFMSMVASSALTDVGSKRLADAGLGRFVKSFKSNFKRMLNKVISTVTGGNHRWMDPTMQTEITQQLKDVVNQALNTYPSNKRNAAFFATSRKKLITWMQDAHRSRARRIVDQKMQELGLVDGTRSGNQWMAEHAGELTAEGLNVLRVGSSLGAKSADEIFNYLTEATTTPRFTYEEGGQLAGLERLTPWSDDVIDVANPNEYDSLGHWLDEVSNMLSTREQLKMIEEGWVENLSASPGVVKELPEHTGELNQFEFLYGRLTHAEMRQAGFTEDWVAGPEWDKLRRKVVYPDVPVAGEMLDPMSEVMRTQAVINEELKKLAPELLIDVTGPQQKIARQVVDKIESLSFPEMIGKKPIWQRKRNVAAEGARSAETQSMFFNQFFKMERSADETYGPTWVFDHDAYSKANTDIRPMATAGDPIFEKGSEGIPFKRVTVDFTPEELDYIEKVVTPNINRQLAAFSELQGKVISFNARVEKATKKGAKILNRKLSKEYKDKMNKQYESKLKVLDAIIDDLGTNPALEGRGEWTKWMAETKLNKKDLTRITDDFITDDALKMSSDELTQFQTKLYRYLGKRNETFTDSIDGNLSKADLQNKDVFTQKEIHFLDTLDSRKTQIDDYIAQGRLSIPRRSALPVVDAVALAANKLKQLRLLRDRVKNSKQNFKENFTDFESHIKGKGKGRGPAERQRDILDETTRTIEGLTKGMSLKNIQRQLNKQFELEDVLRGKHKEAELAAIDEVPNLLKSNPNLNLNRKTFDEIINKGYNPKNYSYKDNGFAPAGETGDELMARAERGGDLVPPSRNVLKNREVKREQRTKPFTVVIERADGTKVNVSSTIFNVPEFSMISMGQGANIGAALRESSRLNGRLVMKGDQINDMTASKWMGHQVSIGPGGFNNAVQKQFKSNTPGKLAPLLKFYDSAHTLMKYMATSLRLPLDFHTSNIISAFPQALMEDIGFTNMAQGMLATARLMSKDPEAIMGLDKASALMQSGKINKSARKQPFPKISTIHDIAEMGRQGVERAGGLVYRGGGNSHSYQDIITALVEEGGFDTMVRSDFVNITNADTALEHIRNMYNMPDGFRKTREGVKRMAELSELFVRMSAMHGAINAGMDLRTAARSVAKAMVDYSDLTMVEKVGLKRLGFFYTFPRKMIPKSLEYMFNNPSKSALLSGVLKDKEHVKTSEGRIETAIGDYRVNIGRLAPQIDSMVALASVADTFMPALGNLITTESGLLKGDARPRRFTGEAAPDKPITPSSILNIMGWENFLPTEDPLSGSADWVEESVRTNWAVKTLAGDPLLGSKDPEVDYSPLEKFARTVTPYRKVRPGQEEQQMIRRISAHRRRYKRELEEAVADGAVTTAQVLNEQIQRMDKRLLELQTIVDKK